MITQVNVIFIYLFIWLIHMVHITGFSQRTQGYINTLLFTLGNKKHRLYSKFCKASFVSHWQRWV